MTGYGPQECWDSNIFSFFFAIDKEISAFKLLGNSVIISMDANSKLGPEIIPGDPYRQSPNGNILAGIVNRHALCVVNGMKEKRKGLITRQRNTETGNEKSIIDFVIVSNDLMEHIDEIHVDDERTHVLTKNTKTKNGIVYSESDHNVINTKIRLKWYPQESKAVEVFKYSDKKALKMF